MWAFADAGVVRRVSEPADPLKVLRGGAKHRGTADINVFDELFGGEIGLGRGRLEGIKIHDDQVDGDDAVLRGFSLIARMLAAVEESAMHLGMQSLDSSAEHFRRAGEPANIFDGEAGFAQHTRVNGASATAKQARGNGTAVKQGEGLQALTRAFSLT